MRRYWHILMACWSLVALPALCSGGLVGHPCDANATPECTDHHGENDGDAPDPGHCEHESTCPDDPCNLTAIPRGNGDECVGPAPQSAVSADILNDVAPAASARCTPTSDLQTRAPGPPFPSSDLPLRI